MAKKKVPARKSVAKKAAPKKSKSTTPKKEVSEVKLAYQKAISLVVRANEMVVDQMDDRSIDEILDDLAAQRKILEGTKKNEVVGRLLKSLTAGVNMVDIDEAADTD